MVEHIAIERPDSIGASLELANHDASERASQQRADPINACDEDWVGAVKLAAAAGERRQGANSAHPHCRDRRAPGDPAGRRRRRTNIAYRSTGLI
jgi:hypothetical protein